MDRARGGRSVSPRVHAQIISCPVPTATPLAYARPPPRRSGGGGGSNLMCVTERARASPVGASPESGELRVRLSLTSVITSACGFICYIRYCHHAIMNLVLCLQSSLRPLRLGRAGSNGPGHVPAYASLAKLTSVHDPASEFTIRSRSLLRVRGRAFSIRRCGFLLVRGPRLLAPFGLLRLALLPARPLRPPLSLELLAPCPLSLPPSASLSLGSSLVGDTLPVTLVSRLLLVAHQHRSLSATRHGWARQLEDGHRCSCRCLDEKVAPAATIALVDAAHRDPQRRYEWQQREEQEEAARHLGSRVAGGRRTRDLIPEIEHSRRAVILRIGYTPNLNADKIQYRLHSGMHNGARPLAQVVAHAFDLEFLHQPFRIFILPTKWTSSRRCLEA